MARNKYFHFRLTSEERQMIRELAGGVPRMEGEAVRVVIRDAYLKQYEDKQEIEPIHIHTLQPV